MRVLSQAERWDFYYDLSPEDLLWGATGPQCILKEIILRLLTSTGKAELNVLDVGCGNGRNSTLFDSVTNLTINYRGIDFSRSAISYCRNKFGHDKTKKFDTFDITEPSGFGHTRAFDLAFDFGCFHAIPPPKRSLYVRNVASAIAEGGFFLLAGWHSRKDNLHDVYYRAYGDLEEWAINETCIKTEFSGYFDIVFFHLDSKEIVINEGFIYALLKKKVE
jgi:SAM-dependent methyltransferase